MNRLIVYTPVQPGFHFILLGNRGYRLHKSVTKSAHTPAMHAFQVAALRTVGMQRCYNVASKSM